MTPLSPQSITLTMCVSIHTNSASRIHRHSRVAALMLSALLLLPLSSGYKDGLAEFSEFSSPVNLLAL